MIKYDELLKAMLFDGKNPEPKEVTLQLTQKSVIVIIQNEHHHYDRHNVFVSPRSGTADRFIYLTDGSQCQCKDLKILDRLPQQLRADGIIAWLENHLSIAIVSIAIVIITLLTGYFYGLPAVAEKVVKTIPIETEITLGNHLLTWLDEKHFFSPSDVPAEQQTVISESFSRLSRQLKMSQHIQLHYRSSSGIGPNAFAFPGGNIVITDQLIELAQSNNEILAILAHESGHVEMRHSMKNLLQSSITALTVATITADASSLGGTMASLPVIFLQTGYSRDFERDADSFALELMQRNNLPPTAFADILTRIDATFAGGVSEGFAFLSTHPITRERIQKFRSSALKQ